MQHVGRLGRQRDEVPERVVRARRLRHLVVRFGLHRVHEVGELHRVLDEEHRDVVADQVPVAFLRVELGREAAHVAHGVGAAALARHRGEAHEHRGALADRREGHGAGDVGQRLGALEVAVRARAARVHDALRDPLVVEVGDLLAQDEVLEQRRPARAEPQRVLVVGDRHALVRRQAPIAGVDPMLRQRADVRVRSRLGLRAVLVVLVALGDRAGGRRRGCRARGARPRARRDRIVRQRVLGRLGAVFRHARRGRFGRVDLRLQPFGHGGAPHGSLSLLVPLPSAVAARSIRPALGRGVRPWPTGPPSFPSRCLPPRRAVLLPFGVSAAAVRCPCLSNRASRRVSCCLPCASPMGDRRLGQSRCRARQTGRRNPRDRTRGTAFARPEDARQRFRNPDPGVARRFDEGKRAGSTLAARSSCKYG